MLPVKLTLLIVSFVSFMGNELHSEYKHKENEYKTIVRLCRSIARQRISYCTRTPELQEKYCKKLQKILQVNARKYCDIMRN